VSESGRKNERTKGTKSGAEASPKQHNPDERNKRQAQSGDGKKVTAKKQLILVSTSAHNLNIFGN
jgi:hypothetical protein